MKAYWILIIGLIWAGYEYTHPDPVEIQEKIKYEWRCDETTR